MKIKKHVIACGFVAGLATVATTGTADTPRLPEAQAGYLVGKLVSDDEDDDLLQAAAQGAGAALGVWGATVLGAKIGAKIGALVGGPLGLAIGGATGAV